MNRIAHRVAARFASLSDSPVKWQGLTKRFLLDRREFRRFKALRGFTLHVTDPANGYFDMAATVDGTDDPRVVGWLFFGPWNGDDRSDDLEGAIEVDPGYRRQGIASAMYVWAEQLTGRKFRPGLGHSADAEAFWQSKNRSFGH